MSVFPLFYPKIKILENIGYATQNQVRTILWSFVKKRFGACRTTILSGIKGRNIIFLSGGNGLYG